MSRTSWDRLAGWLLLTIVAVYAILGTAYAVVTPSWQAPDEPAHYNYVRHIADLHTLPMLKPGDFPAAYMEEIKAAGFPPEMSIEPIRYEFHQPPLYYLLAVPVYRLFGGALLPVRLLSVLIGALLLLVAFWTMQELAPAHPGLALGATAFVAFLPMHLAMTAAANNDTLAELLVATVLLLAIRYLKRTSLPNDEREDTRLLVLLGITTGLGLVTKSSVYVTLPLILAAIAARHLWLDRPAPPASSTLKALVLYLLPAFALAVPWWLRNLALYGGLDFLGLVRHEQVVVGQLRTEQFVDAHGAARLAQEFLVTSFHSFWGQFGWMGVLLDQRIYQALVIFSALAMLGFLIWLARAWRRRGSYSEWLWAVGGLLALSGLFTMASYLWYNTRFVQHQGRYLFPALVAIGLVVALGWREVLRRERALIVASLLLGSAAILRVAGLLPNWPLLMLVVAAVVFAIRHFLPRSWNPAVGSSPYLFLVALDLAALIFFIVPQLGR